MCVRIWGLWSWIALFHLETCAEVEYFYPELTGESPLELFRLETGCLSSSVSFRRRSSSRVSVSFLLEAEPPRAPPTDQSSHRRRRCRPRGPDGCFGVFGLPVLPPVPAGPLLWPEVVQRSAWDPAGLKGAKHLWESRAEEETKELPGVPPLSRGTSNSSRLELRWMLLLMLLGLRGPQFMVVSLYWEDTSGPVGRGCGRVLILLKVQNQP